MERAVKSTLPVTPDGRYFVVRGRLWRCTNPFLSAEVKKVLVDELMQARREKGSALRGGDNAGRDVARQRIDEIKKQLVSGVPFGGRTARLTGIGIWQRTPHMPIGMLGYLAETLIKS